MRDDALAVLAMLVSDDGPTSSLFFGRERFELPQGHLREFFGNLELLVPTHLPIAEDLLFAQHDDLQKRLRLGPLFE